MREPRTSSRILQVAGVLIVALVIAGLMVQREGKGEPRGGGSAERPAPGKRGGAFRIPMAFVPNLGQWEVPARYVARKGPMQAFFHERGWVFTLEERRASQGKEKGATVDLDPRASFHARHALPEPGRRLAIRMTFLGAGEGSRVHGGKRLPGVHHYLLGRDRSRWRRDVPLYGELSYEGLYPGVEVRVREGKGLFEYDLMLEPGADLGWVKVKVEGAEGLRIAPSGALVMETGLGEVRQPAPETWELGPGGRKRPVECRYVVLGRDTFGFRVPRRDRTYPLFLDPGLVWSTYMGGGDYDHILGLAVDKTGEVTLAGRTNSVNYPVTAGVYQPKFKGGKYRICDVMVTRLNRLGTALKWSTFLGGKGDEYAASVSLLPGGVALVGGVTTSRDFPVTSNAFQRSYQGGDDYLGSTGYREKPLAFWGDAFLTALGPKGKKLIFSTYLGGSSSDYIRSIYGNSKGIVAVTGGTKSKDFPVTPGCFQPKLKGPLWPHVRSDAFVTVFEPLKGKVLWSTYLGSCNTSRSSGDDVGQDIVVGEDGHVTVMGWAGGQDFPVTEGVWSRKYNPHGELFLTRFAPSGKKLLWSTFLCGFGKVNVPFIRGPVPGAIDEDPVGNVYFGGTIDVFQPWDGTFPTTSYVWDRYGWLDFEGLVVKLDSQGKRILWSTYIGCTLSGNCSGSMTNIRDLAVDSHGSVTVVGDTNDPTFPITPNSSGGYMGRAGGRAFVARLDPLGRRLFYSTYLMGTVISRKDPCLWQVAYGVHVTDGGVATVAGFTGFVDFPVTSGAFQTFYGGGGSDAFVFRLPLFTMGVRRFGEPTHHVEGEPALYVTSDPVEGDKKFGFEGWKAPGVTWGVLILGWNAIPGGKEILGVKLYVQPSLVLLVKSDKKRKGRVSLPLPQGSRGAKLYAQMIWLNTPPYGPVGTLSATGALEVTVR